MSGCVLEVVVPEPESDALNKALMGASDVIPLRFDADRNGIRALAVACVNAASPSQRVVVFSRKRRGLQVPAIASS